MSILRLLARVLLPAAMMRALAALAAAFGAASAAPAQNSYQQVIDRAVAGGIPGIQAVVLVGDREWAGVAGVSAVERRRAMQRGNRLRVASITKMFTYAVIVELARRGRLGLDDRAVDRLAPGTLDGIPHAGEIRIRHLLEHVSGVHNFNGEQGADFFAALYGDRRRSSRLWTARELIAFARRPNNWPTGTPGERRSYSSTGYIILELIAERAGGAPLPLLYRRFIFDPLGMRRTGVEGHDLTARDIVDSYGRPPADAAAGTPSPFAGRRAVRADGLVNLSAGLRTYNGWARGAGAAASTACDLARFMHAVVAGRMTVLQDQQQTFAAAAARPLATFGWNGGAEGIQASIVYAPASDAIVVVLTNGTNVGDTSQDIARRLLEAVRAGGDGAAEPAAPSNCPP